MDDFLRTSGREERQQEQWFILKLKADIKEQEPKQTKKETENMHLTFTCGLQSNQEQ